MPARIKATSVVPVDRSVYNLLQRTPAGAALADAAGIGPIGPERGRNFDVGIEQGLWKGRARARAAYFNNEFFDLVEFVSKNLLPQFGIPPDVAAASGTGAYVNSQSYTAQGLEMAADAMFGRMRLAGSYTYVDAEVTESLSSSVTPQFNPSFPSIPIGGFTALVGQRPFRRPANVGSLMFGYAQGPASVALTGYFAGKADDSAFIVGTDINFREHHAPAQSRPQRRLSEDRRERLLRDASQGEVVCDRRNMLDQHYEPSFGFPRAADQRANRTDGHLRRAIGVAGFETVRACTASCSRAPSPPRLTPAARGQRHDGMRAAIRIRRRTTFPTRSPSRMRRTSPSIPAILQDRHGESGVSVGPAERPSFSMRRGGAKSSEEPWPARRSQVPSRRSFPRQRRTFRCSSISGHVDVLTGVARLGDLMGDADCRPRAQPVASASLRADPWSTRSSSSPIVRRCS